MERAWAAGLFDGEGSVYYFCKQNTARHRVGQRQIALVVGQSGNPAVLVRFRDAVGCGYIRGPMDKSASGQRRQAAFQFSVASFEAVQWCIIQLWPYLCTPKRQQASRALRAFVDDKRRMMQLPRLRSIRSQELLT